MVVESANPGIDGVIITADLDRRPSRAPDHEAEARALNTLAKALSTDPGAVLQRLVELAMELTRSGSAGISLLEPGGTNGTFRWAATAGAWSSYRDGTMPREASPCGEVIARETVLLMKNPERSFPALRQAEPGINEGLLAPFYVGGVPVGTVWTVKHRPDEHFEAEDARVLASLASFAAAAHQMIEALRRAEVAGDQAELRFQQLVTLADVSSEFFGTCDMDFMPIYGNAAAMRMVGLADLEEVKRTPLQAFFFPEDLPFITEDFFPRVLRDGQAKVEIRFRHFVTGEPVWVDYSLVVLKDKTGRATGLGTVTHDLTERKRSEAALQISEARFRALATVGSSSIYRMSPDWREMWQLDGATFLADVDKATADWVDTYIPPDERPRVREAINRAIAAKDVFELEHRVLRADGTIGWTFSRAIPLFDDTGEISEWFGAATDVTARVKADRSFTHVFQASPAPFLVLKPDAPRFTIAEVNDAYLSATMRTRDDVVGRGIFEAYPDNPSEGSTGGVGALRASLERVLATRQPDALPGLKYDVARPDGTFEERWWSPINSAVLDDDGQVAALIHNANDVTVERAAEIALREREERQAFLLRLSDALRAERSAEAMANRALRMLFEQMRLDRCCIVIYRLAEDIGDLPHQVHDDRLPPLPDQVRLSDFPKGLQVLFDQTWVVDDVVEMDSFSSTDHASVDSLGLRAFINATLRKGENNPLWAIVAASTSARKWTKGEVALVEEVAERTWAAIERARAETRLRDSEERFRQFSDASTDVLWIRNAATMRMEFASPAFDSIYGIPGPDRGGNDSLRGWLRLIEPDGRKGVLANFRRVRAGDRIEQEFQIRRASDGALRWIHNTDFPLHDATGKVAWVAGLGADITDARESVDRQDVLVAELQHRTRNLIAVVRSLADRTLGNAASLEDFGERFRLRLSALSRVQGLLSDLAAGARVTFDELLRMELAAHGVTDGTADKVTLDGPEGVSLRSGTVQTLALGLHELATNAIKYGALKAPEGHLSVRWHVEPGAHDDDPRLHVEWQERGVVMPLPGELPRTGGYGRELIERALPYQLKAQTSYELGADGVRCTIAVPISRRGMEDASGSTSGSD